MADLDVFFYLLENGFDGDYEALKKNADLYCLATFNADQFPLLPKVLMTSIRIAFFPLTFIPSTVHLEGKKKVLFDSDWLASITSIVHEETGLTADEIMKKPLCFCEYYFLQFLRKNGEKHIERQPEEETSRLKAKRYCELLIEWAVKQQIIKEDEKEDMMKILSEE